MIQLHQLDYPIMHYIVQTFYYLLAEQFFKLLTPCLNIKSLVFLISESDKMILRHYKYVALPGLQNLVHKYNY